MGLTRQGIANTFTEDLHVLETLDEDFNLDKFTEAREAGRIDPFFMSLLSSFCAASQPTLLPRLSMTSIPESDLEEAGAAATDRSKDFTGARFSEEAAGEEVSSTDATDADSSHSDDSRVSDEVNALQVQTAPDLPEPEVVSSQPTSIGGGIESGDQHLSTAFVQLEGAVRREMDFQAEQFNVDFDADFMEEAKSPADLSDYGVSGFMQMPGRTQPPHEKLLDSDATASSGVAVSEAVSYVDAQNAANQIQSIVIDLVDAPRAMLSASEPSSLRTPFPPLTRRASNTPPPRLHRTTVTTTRKPLWESVDDILGRTFLTVTAKQLAEHMVILRPCQEVAPAAGLSTSQAMACVGAGRRK